MNMDEHNIITVWHLENGVYNNTHMVEHITPFSLIIESGFK